MSKHGLVALCYLMTVAGNAGAAVSGTERGEVEPPLVQSAASDLALVDPFAANETSGLPAVESTSFSTWSGTLDALYQGTYLPGVGGDAGGHRSRQDAFLDGAATWKPNSTALVAGRLVGNYEERKSAQNDGYQNRFTALEYYYQQRTDNGDQALTVGRRVLGWSSGFQWRPADLIENGFSTKNIDQKNPYRYRGVDQLRYDLIGSSADLSMLVSSQDNHFYDGNQFALRASVRGWIGASLLYSHNGDYSSKKGLVLDGNLPGAITFSLEAVHVDVDRRRMLAPWRRGIRLESLSGVDNYEDVYLSLTHFIDEKRRVSLEYFHNGRGFQQAAPQKGGASIVGNNSLFEQEYLRRNYVYPSYTGYIDEWALQWKPSVMFNLDDNSYMTSFSLMREIGGASEVSLNFNTFHGTTGTEFGSVSKGVGVGLSYTNHVF